ncbi:potassium channel family protein [Chloroflexota bacterium]
MKNNNASWLKHLWRTLKPSRQKQVNTTWRFDNSNHGDRYMVIGLGQFGISLAMTLTGYHHHVLAIDSDNKRVKEASRVLPHVIQLDATSIEALQEVGVESFDTGIVCIGSDFQASLLATVSLHKLGVSRVIAKARTTTQQEILRSAGATEVILPNHEAGVRLTRQLAAIDFVDFLDLGGDTGVAEITTPHRFINRSLRETKIRQRYGVIVVAIKRSSSVIISPAADEVILENDVLVILGRTIDCEKFRGRR